LHAISHLIEVYLEPRRFVDINGLAEDEAAERIVATQKVALRMLLPTERDTLAGAIKVLTEAITRNITLKRSVAGLMTMGRSSAAFAIRPARSATAGAD
jgi:hypothetical protein